MKVERDLDLETESFIQPEEMLGYANEAIRDVEKEIHKLNQDYFLKRGTISLQQGVEEYQLPSDIYGMKVRGVIYREGSSVWKVERVRDWYKFENYEFDQTNLNDTQRYAYFLLNQTVGSPTILITPTPNTTSTLRFWYIRSANQLVNDSSICDIPEAYDYVVQAMKVRCYEKDIGNPNLQKAMADLESIKAKTLTALSDIVVDNSNEIEADTRLYEEMS